MKWIKKGLIFEPPKNLKWMVFHAAVPFAFRIDHDLYRIYFSGRSIFNKSQIGFIEININKPEEVFSIASEPIIKTGEFGTFDESGAMASWLCEYSNCMYLYYIGWNTGGTLPFRNSIGLALSYDGGRTFEKYGDGPVVDRSIYDACFVASPCVLIENNIWRMWYVSGIKWTVENNAPKHYYHIKYAESKDGIIWDRKGIVCIDFKSPDEYAIARPCVLKENGIYKMWYSYRGKSYRIGYAESKDGLRWERKDNEVGIDVSDTGWDSEMICYAHVFEHNGKKYMLYNGNGYGKTGIGLAILEQ
ncbi:MAG: hypothetical protein ABIJ15_04025 [bacterium]